MTTKKRSSAFQATIECSACPAKIPATPKDHLTFSIVKESTLAAIGQVIPNIYNTLTDEKTFLS